MRGADARALDQQVNRTNAPVVVLIEVVKLLFGEVVNICATHVQLRENALLIERMCVVIPIDS